MDKLKKKKRKRFILRYIQKWMRNCIVSIDLLERFWRESIFHLLSQSCTQGSAPYFCVLNPEKLHVNTSNAAIPALGQNNHGFSDPKSPLPFSVPYVPPQDVLHRTRAMYWPLHGHSWALQKAGWKPGISLWYSWLQLGWLFFCRFSLFLFLRGTTYRWMHLVQRSLWSFPLSLQEGKGFWRHHILFWQYVLAQASPHDLSCYVSHSWCDLLI